MIVNITKCLSNISRIFLSTYQHIYLMCIWKITPPAKKICLF